MTIRDEYQQMVGRGMFQAESEPMEHKYVLSGYKVEWPDGSQEIAKSVGTAGTPDLESWKPTLAPSRPTTNSCTRSTKFTA